MVLKKVLSIEVTSGVSQRRRQNLLRVYKPAIIWGSRNSQVSIILAILFIVGLCISSSVYGQEGQTSAEIGITEKLGHYVPLALTFRDENGAVMRLRDLINKPAVVALVYYTCDRFCPQMLGALSEVIPKLNLVAGRDYTVMTISFDEADTPEVAAQRKANYVKALNQPFPEESWRFLTGDKENIQQLTKAVGFAFQRENHGFSHPSALIILSPDGKITRYVYVSKYQYGLAYPVSFSPVELSNALSDASQGRVSRAIRQTIAYCFPHGSKEQDRFFTILTVVGTATLLCVLGLFLYLRTTSRKSPLERP